MICSNLSALIGFQCHPLNEDGTVAMISTPFCFEDGDSVPVFVERAGPQLRFFDDGGVLLHLRGRGVRLGDHRRTRFIRQATQPYGVELNEMGELEIWAREADAAQAFSNYISAMVSLTSWEREQEGISTDMALLIDEVAMCLEAWKPNAKISRHPEYTGITGHVYKLDFLVDGEAVTAISTHHAAVAAAARKLLDIKASPANMELPMLVVIDDRRDAEAAKRESMVLSTVARVLPMSRLERNARMEKRAQQ